MDRLSILQLSLHGSVVGHLAGYSHGKNILLFADEFRRNPERPTLSLITHPNFPKSEELLARDWSRHQRLHPLLSNLLPEGARRELLAHSLKNHIDHEFSLLAWLGLDLPGALIARPLTLDNLPAVRLPAEPLAFAIRRFDRQRGVHVTERIHMEDFAQVLAKYPHEKYGSANYEQIGRILYQFSGDGIADAQQFARRLLVNILLANGDAHLKNWSLLYSDHYTPRLSPAYDIVTTSVYMDNERTTALNMAGQKVWYQTSMESFQQWAKKAGIPWRLIKLHLDDTLDKARTLWPKALVELPMFEPHKQALKVHWKHLHTDFRLPDC